MNDNTASFSFSITVFLTLRKQNVTVTDGQGRGDTSTGCNLVKKGCVQEKGKEFKQDSANRANLTAEILSPCGVLSFLHLVVINEKNRSEKYAL